MQWVSVKDRLPEKFKNVMIFKEGLWDEPGIGYYADEIWYAWLEGIGQTNITHWMPLPEPPTSSNNEFKATKAP